MPIATYLHYFYDKLLRSQSRNSLATLFFSIETMHCYKNVRDLCETYNITSYTSRKLKSFLFLFGKLHFSRCEMCTRIVNSSLCRLCECRPCMLNGTLSLYLILKIFYIRFNAACFREVYNGITACMIIARSLSWTC